MMFSNLEVENSLRNTISLNSKVLQLFTESELCALKA